MKRILALLTIALLLVVLGILASCEAFDAVTGDITKPADPVAATQPVATQSASPAVANVMAMVDAVEQAVVDADTDLAKAEAEFSASGNADMAAEIARLRKHRSELATQLGIVRAVAQAMVSGWENRDGKPAEVVVRETFGPIADMIPGWGGIAVGLVGGILGLIQRARKRKAEADAAAQKAAKEKAAQEAAVNMATAENLVTSLEAMKVAGLSMTTDEGRAVLSTVQTPETQALVRKLTTKSTD